MKILAIDTSGPALSAAVSVDGHIAASVYVHQGLTHSETLMPAVDSALNSCGLCPSDLDAFAVVHGPGSYTGVRIGVCAAKGFAHAVGKPCCPVHALEALAMNVVGFDGVAVPMLNARRGQVYAAAFDVSSGRPQRILDDDACPLEEYLARLPETGKLMFLGDGMDAYGEKILKIMGSRASVAPEHLVNIRADAACLLAGDESRWIPAEALRPLYLRASQAERERAERLKQEGKA